MNTETVSASQAGQSAIAPGQDAELLPRARKRFQASMDFDRENDEAALEDLNFCTGNQWDADVLAERTADDRPSLTIDKTNQFIAQVTGEIRKRPPSMVVTPADGAASPAIAQLMEGMLRATERLSRAQDVYSRAADSSARCSKGHWRIALEFADEDSLDEMELFIRSIYNPFAVKWDPHAAEADKSDANYCFVYENMSKEAFKASYPKAPETSWPVTQPLARQSASCWTNHQVDTVTVAEYWEVEKTPTTLMRVRHIQSGVEKPVHLGPQYDVEEYSQYLAQSGYVILGTRPSSKKTIVRYLLAGNDVLEGRRVWPGKRIPIFTVLGEVTYVGDKVVESSLIRPAKDAIRGQNYIVSSQIEAVANVPKVPWVLADEAIEGFEDEWNNANKRPLAYLRYKAFSGEKSERAIPAPRRADPIVTNPGLSEMAAAFAQFQKDTIGIHDASLGNRSNETSGVAIEARDAQADTRTYVYLANLLTQIEATGRELLVLYPQTVSARTMVRTVGKDDVPAIIDLERMKADGLTLDLGKYDCVVQTGQGFASQRKETAKGMEVLMGKQLPPPVLAMLIPEYAKLMDWEGAAEIAAKIEQAMNPQPPGPPMGPGGPGMPPPGMMPPGGPPGPTPQRAGPPGPPPGQRPPQMPGRPDPFANILPFRPSGFPPAPDERVAPQAMPAGRAGMMGVR